MEALPGPRLGADANPQPSADSPTPSVSDSRTSSVSDSSPPSSIAAASPPLRAKRAAVTLEHVVEVFRRHNRDAALARRVFELALGATTPPTGEVPNPDGGQAPATPSPGAVAGEKGGGAGGGTTRNAGVPPPPPAPLPSPRQKLALEQFIRGAVAAPMLADVLLCQPRSHLVRAFQGGCGAMIAGAT